MSIFIRLKSFLEENQIPYSVMTTGFSPLFFGWRNKSGTQLCRWRCYLGLLGESGYSQLRVTRSSSHVF
jgi:hypothetical protein